jgi:ATP-dependent Clp protease adaptor protein ClpS
MRLQADIEHDIEQDTDIATEQTEFLEPLWHVYVHNDDVTPFDFVLVILQRIFELNPLEAEHVTYVAHTSGIAYVATLPKTEAEKRVGKAHFAASLEGYPLTFTIEPE